MAEATNRFDLTEVLNEMKDFVRARTGAAMQHVQHKPSAHQLETAVLSALAAGPKNAAQVVAAISVASAGGASLTAAQVHPVLAKLTDDGLLKAKAKDDRKEFSITDLGREALAEAGAAANEKLNEKTADSENAGSKPSWASAKDWLQFDPNFMKSAAKLAPAISDVAKTGTRAQQEQASKVLEEARRQLHLILAEG
jgi:DNA-binding PadR family transcriptional regulator